MSEVNKNVRLTEEQQSRTSIEEFIVDEMGKLRNACSVYLPVKQGFQ